MKNIGIIGAGAAGLCALKHVISKGLNPFIWEQSNELGGTWVYTSKTGKDEHGYPIHSSMYASLITNLPKEIMAFPDFPFKEDENSFLHHTKILQYLNEYADHFGLKPWIKFNHRVEFVEPIEIENRFTKWRVTVKNLIENTSSTVELDGIIICNGHYFEPRLPVIENIDAFEGSEMHSHSYRVPEPFVGSKTVVLGANGSGLDISLEIAKKAELVYLSHNRPVPFPSTLPANVHQVTGVQAAKRDGFVLKDNTFIQADSIVYCTGYEYTFPFLSPSCGIRVEDNQVQTLYKHVLNAAFPTMGLIGIPFMICPFPNFDFQVQYIIAAIERLVVVPPLEAVRAEQLKSSIPKRHYHQLGAAQWSYMDDIRSATNTKVLPQFYQKIFDIVHYRRLFFLPQYKRFKYSYKRKNEQIEIVEEFDGQVRNTSFDLIISGAKQMLLILVFYVPSVIAKKITLFRLQSNK